LIGLSIGKETEISASEDRFKGDMDYNDYSERINDGRIKQSRNGHPSAAYRTWNRLRHDSAE